MSGRSTAEIVAELRDAAMPDDGEYTDGYDILMRDAADRLAELDAELTALKTKTGTAATKWRRVGAKAPHDDGGPETAA